MLAVWFFFTLVSLIGVFGFAIMASDNYGWGGRIAGGLAVTCVFLTGLFFYKGIHVDNVNTHRSHMKALRQLQAQGWRVKSNDIHILDHKVDIACLRLQLKKFGKAYQVATKRDKMVGGGYNILKPSSQRSLVKLCTRHKDESFKLKTKAGNIIVSVETKDK